MRRSANRFALACLASLWLGDGMVTRCAAQPTGEPAPGSIFIPIPVIFYTPETELGLGGAFSYIYRPEGSTLQDRPSSFAGTVIFTTRGQFLAAFGANHYWDRERNHLEGGLSYRKFPDTFFGLGMDTPSEGQEYTDEGTSLNFTYLRRLVPRIRFGGSLVSATSSITETQPGDLLHDGRIPGSQGGGVLGGGLKSNYDSRNNISYPTRGQFFDVSWLVYGDFWVGDYNLNNISVDLRQYVSLGGRKVVALRALGVSAGGNVPFQLMTALGGQNLMRGYFAGRFRDRKAAVVQAEIRGDVWWRFGLAVFGSAGQVAPEIDAMRWDRLRTAYGVGARMLLIEQEGLNLRFDWGWGEDQSGFYFSLGEAF